MGLTNVVPDVPIWYDYVTTSAGKVRVGPIDPLFYQNADHNTWEPWVSVIGEKVFLVECPKFADDGTFSNQRYITAFQPARPGTWADAKIGECFYDDYGKPYTNSISSRQDGNPGRIYGDRRYDGVNFVAGGEADPEDHLDFFGGLAPLDGRYYYDQFRYWASAGGTRCGLVQCFSLNMTNLTQASLCKAFDGNALGHPEFATRGDLVGDQQMGRFGGGLAALDNGNFVSLINDRSLCFPASGNTGSGQNEAIAAIFNPTGGVVKASWLVATNAHDNQAWTDPCGFKGGFCVRYGVGAAYGPNDAWLGFFDNAGNLVATNMCNTASGLSLDTGRGDGTKIAGDIRTPWVFLASGPWLTVWNGTNGAFLAKYQYTDDLDAANSVNRTDVASDSLGNVCVAWDGTPLPAFGNNQAMARCFHFNYAGSSSTLTPVTHTFFPFINHDSNTNSILGYKTENTAIDMTTRYICIAAKGVINSTNNVAGGPDSYPQTTVYTLISNPGYVAPHITTASTGVNTITISWPASAGDGALQSTSSLSPASWGNVTPQPATVLVDGTTYTKTVTVSGKTFFRLAL